MPSVSVIVPVYDPGPHIDDCIRSLLGQTLPREELELIFVDNDDWIEPDALERLVAMAREDRADIVIGKVVGHGKRVPRALFERNLHGVPFDSPQFLSLLTPHKLFRRDLVERKRIRFPEGR